MPPLALISSAASCAACGIETPAIACASAMTPILIGSAAIAWPEAMTRPSAVAPSKPRIDQNLGGWEVVVIIVSLHTEFLFACRHTNRAGAPGKGVAGKIRPSCRDLS